MPDVLLEQGAKLLLLGFGHGALGMGTNCIGDRNSAKIFTVSRASMMVAHAILVSTSDVRECIDADVVVDGPGRETARKAAGVPVVTAARNESGTVTFKPTCRRIAPQKG